MKIGILTFHNAENYGAVLQAYALKTFITTIDSNNNVEILDYRNKQIELAYKPIKPIKYFNKNILRNIISFFLQFIYSLPRSKVKKAFDIFKMRYLKPVEPIFDDFDVIVYGSDQVWNPAITDNDLIFLGDKFSGRKIAYAASDGGELPLTEKNVFMLRNYSVITCREKTLSKKISEWLSNDISTEIFNNGSLFKGQTILHLLQ